MPRLAKVLVPLAIVVVGVGAAVLLASARTAPERSEQTALGPLVEVVVAEPTELPVGVRGHGEVTAKRTVNLVPEVSGRVLEVHPSMVAGGFFRVGETLVSLDARDYELAVDRARAAVARAEVALERESAEAEVARQEWDALNPGEAPPSGLVVREPQVRQAEAELEAARADLAVAELNLERTKLSLPFDGVVVSENVDIGQFATVGSVLATVYSTDLVEVRVPLEDRELAWFEAPLRPGGRGPDATVITRFAGQEHRWSGRVARLEAEVDRASRMVNVVVEVPRPFDPSDERPPLLPGMFVDVVIDGRIVSSVVPVPRYAIHDGAVWVAEDGRLRIRPVEVVRSEREITWIGGGLTAGDEVIVSPLDAVTDGMEIRTTTPEPATADAGGGAA
jgi:RND family efflux transporter MFP subunit